MKTRRIIVCGLLTVILAFTFTVCNDGGGNSDYWKITWNLNGGTFASGSNHPTQIEKDAVLAKPYPNPTKAGNYFNGWYSNSGLTQAYNFAGPVTADLYLYAKWEVGDQPPADINVTAGSTLAEKLQWVWHNLQINATYFIKVNDDETIAPQDLAYADMGITIHLEGIDGEKVISCSSYKDSIFSVHKGVTLILDNNITLKGGGPIVSVSDGGAFEIREGVKLSDGNESSGGGVYVRGTFTMNGGEISGNTATSGGGVSVFYGTFTMNGGKISGNTAAAAYFDNCGGGVEVYKGTFTMNGGEITGNTAQYGGGVYILDGTFTMNNGTISGNTAQYYNTYNYSGGNGGGVYVGNNGNFRIVTGTVYGSDAEVGLRNTADSGAALYGTAQYGTFSGETWTSAGNLSTTNNTIKVVNGVLQQ